MLLMVLIMQFSGIVWDSELCMSMEITSGIVAMIPTAQRLIAAANSVVVVSQISFWMY